MVIPFAYNVLKRHPALMHMINRVDDVEEPGMLHAIMLAGGWPDVTLDPFDPEEKDPMLTNALDSSLWELASHVNHYHPSVSTLANIFREAFRKPNYTLEDFLDHTYGTVRNRSPCASFPLTYFVYPQLFESEVRRKVKKDPAVAMELKKYLLLTADQKEEISEEVISVQGDVVTDLWTF